MAQLEQDGLASRERGEVSAASASPAATPDSAFNWKVSGPHLSATRDGQYGYREGSIITKHGIVSLYDQGRDIPLTRLDFVAGGRCYAGSWGRTFSDRYLKTLASRFAASVLSEAARPAGGEAVRSRTADDKPGMPSTTDTAEGA